MTSGSVFIERVLNQPLHKQYNKIRTNKKPLAGLFAKQNRMGSCPSRINYSSTLTLIPKHYSRFLENCKGFQTAEIETFFLKTKYLYPTKFQMNVTRMPATGATMSTHSFVSGPIAFTSVATATFAPHPMSAIV